MNTGLISDTQEKFLQYIDLDEESKIKRLYYLADAIDSLVRDSVVSFSYDQEQYYSYTINIDYGPKYYLTLEVVISSKSFSLKSSLLVRRIYKTAGYETDYNTYGKIRIKTIEWRD